MTKYFFTAEIFLHCSLRVYIPLFLPPQCLQIWSVLNPLLKNISAGVSSGYALPLSSAQKYLFLTKMLKEEEELNLNVNLHLCDTISANLYGVDTLCSKVSTITVFCRVTFIWSIICHSYIWYTVFSKYRWHGISVFK